MSVELDQILKECCKICGTYRCSTHLAAEWVVCPGCPSQGKYWLKFHPKCPYCGAVPPEIV